MLFEARINFVFLSYVEQMGGRRRISVTLCIKSDMLVEDGVKENGAT